MEDFKAILKDYGPAIGPALAFLLGMLALVIKFFIDQWTDVWSTRRQFKRLKSLLSNLEPPVFRKPEEIEKEEATVLVYDGANAIDVAIFHAMLVALTPTFDTLEKSVSESGDFQMIMQFDDIKRKFERLKVHINKRMADPKKFCQSPQALQTIKFLLNDLKSSAMKNRSGYLKVGD